MEPDVATGVNDKEDDRKRSEDRGAASVLMTNLFMCDFICFYYLLVILQLQNYVFFYLRGILKDLRTFVMEGRLLWVAEASKL